LRGRDPPSSYSRVLLAIRPDQLHALASLRRDPFLTDLAAWARARYPLTLAGLSADQLREALERGLAEVDALAGSDRALFAVARVLLGSPLTTTDWGRRALRAAELGDPHASELLANDLLLHLDLAD
jgi:hypothetical protein